MEARISTRGQFILFIYILGNGWKQWFVTMSEKTIQGDQKITFSRVPGNHCFNAFWFKHIKEKINTELYIKTNHHDGKLFSQLLKCTHFSFKKTSTAAASTCLRSVSWMELVGGCMNPSPVLDFWAKPAWWSPEPSFCARWQLGDRVPGQASAGHRSGPLATAVVPPGTTPPLLTCTLFLVYLRPPGSLAGR